MDTPDIRFVSNLLPHLVCTADLDVSEETNARWLAEIQALRGADPDGREVSNHGGWQQEIHDRDPFQPLLDRIGAVSLALLRRYRVPAERVTLTGLWANMNGYRDYNAMHRHNGDLSGVYYVSAPPDSGHLVLVSIAAFCVESGLVKSARDEDGNSLLVHRVTPRAGRMALFSSETHHHVEASQAELPRVSIAWNAQVTGPA